MIVPCRMLLGLSSQARMRDHDTVMRVQHRYGQSGPPALHHNALAVQDLFLIDVKHPSVQLLKHRTMHCTDVIFAPVSQAFLVAWRTDPTQHCSISVDVINRDGDLIASFHDMLDCWSLSWVPLPVSKVAIAQVACFKVWDQSSGRLLATAGPDTTANGPMRHGGGQIAVSPSGSRLAFIPVPMAGEMAAYVYSVETLQPVSRYCIEDASAIHRQACNSLTSKLVWGVHGCLLTYSPSGAQPDFGHLQRLAFQADDEIFVDRVLQTCKAREPPALSPCGAFVLLFQPKGARLNVCETCSGRTMMSLPVGLPDLRGKKRVSYYLALHWSTSGCQLLARVRAVSAAADLDKQWTDDRLVMVQLL